MDKFDYFKQKENMMRLKGKRISTTSKPKERDQTKMLIVNRKSLEPVEQQVKR